MSGVGRPRRTAQSNVPAENIPIQKPEKVKPINKINKIIKLYYINYS
jgi:hypothetical protein